MLKLRNKIGNEVNLNLPISLVDSRDTSNSIVQTDTAWNFSRLFQGRPPLPHEPSNLEWLASGCLRVMCSFVCSLLRTDVRTLAALFENRALWTPFSFRFVWHSWHSAHVMLLFIFTRLLVSFPFLFSLGILYPTPPCIFTIIFWITTRL